MKTFILSLIFSLVAVGIFTEDTDLCQEAETVLSDKKTLKAAFGLLDGNGDCSISVDEMFAVARKDNQTTKQDLLDYLATRGYKGQTDFNVVEFVDLASPHLAELEGMVMEE